MNSTTCVIYNPAAGRGRAESLLKKLRATLGAEIQFEPTSYPGHGIELARAAARAGIARVIAAGGDGTVHEVANGILSSGKCEVIFSVWPIGSANDYAYTLGMQQWWNRREEALPTEVMDVDVGRVSGGGRECYFVDSLGVGFNGMVTIESRKIHWLRGMPLYALAFLQAMVKHFNKPRMQVTFDGVLTEGPTLALSLLLAQREGGFPLRPEASLTDGRFDYMHAGALARRHLIRYLPAMMTGRLPEHHPLLRLGHAVCVDVASEAPLCVHTDGEFFCLPEEGLQEIRAEVLPGRLRVEVFRAGLYGGRGTKKPTRSEGVGRLADGDQLCGISTRHQPKSR